MTPETTRLVQALASEHRLRILAELRQAGEPLNSGELARRVNRHAGNTSVNLGRLEALGLIERRRDGQTVKVGFRPEALTPLRELLEWLEGRPS